MLLTDARRAARVDAGGALVTLDEQDRSLWDRAKIAEGHDLVRECLRRNRPGHYQLLAAVNAVHTDAATAADTDWRQVLALYDQLYAVTPTPVVALNRAVALAEVEGAGIRPGRRRRARPRRATTRTTRPGPTCCAGWAGTPRRWPPTTGRSSSRRTRPSGPCSRPGATP